MTPRGIWDSLLPSTLQVGGIQTPSTLTRVIMKSLRTLTLPALLMLGTLIIGCDTGISGAEAEQPVHKYSGEEILRGLVFGQGPVADLFPELINRQAIDDHVSAMTPEARAAYYTQVEKTRTQFDALLAEIEQDDPAFLDRFAAAMQSGNHIEIERALEAIQKQWVSAAARMAGLSQAEMEKLAEDDTLMQTLQAQGIVIDIQTFCIAVLFIAMVTETWCEVFIVFNTVIARMDRAGLAEAGLERDRYVNLIAGRL